MASSVLNTYLATILCYEFMEQVRGFIIIIIFLSWCIAENVCEGMDKIRVPIFYSTYNVILILFLNLVITYRNYPEIRLLPSFIGAFLATLHFTILCIRSVLIKFVAITFFISTLISYYLCPVRNWEMDLFLLCLVSFIITFFIAIKLSFLERISLTMH